MTRYVEQINQGLDNMNLTSLWVSPEDERLPKIQCLRKDLVNLILRWHTLDFTHDPDQSFFLNERTSE